MKTGAPSDAAAPASESRVYVVSGDVYVTQGKHPAHRVVKSEPIASDTLVETRNGSAALLKFADGQVVTMQANSLFKVREYRYDPKHISNSSAVFSMFQGGMRFITGLIGKLNHQSFRLSTPNVTIGIRGTEFMLVMDGHSMYSRVLKGKIAMTNAAGMKVVRAGHTAVVSSSVKLASLVSGSAIPAGTFGALLAVPVEPSAIPAPAPEPPPVPAMPVATPVAAVPAAAETAPPIETAPPAIPEESPEPEAADEMDRNSRSDLAVVGKVGSLGLGAELALGLTDSLGARIGLNAFNYNYNATSSTVNYDFKLQLQTVSALADWYPFEGSFRTSVGVMYNNNKVSLAGLPTGGTYTINGTTYNSTDVGSLQGEMAFNKVAPYIGIGWGNPAEKDKGWGFTSDIGVLFQGNPKTSLVATCSSAIAGTASCTQLQSDAAAENTKLQSDLSNFKWWPVASIGISYQW
ncbi:MAG: FecR domain-containing protein [Gallionella sp.]|nr:FecR domain-containing protein [Gallionella sp.]